jgi:diaminohydroxyphosphoribosylaminopyrimidine deaminase / 5-amino-6-(5-phosphoribosylamino)uracil reductase
LYHHPEEGKQRNENHSQPLAAEFPATSIPFNCIAPSITPHYLLATRRTIVILCHMNHTQYMNQAFMMALSRMGITSPNPPVGAIVVKNGSIVSSGGTQVCGGDHAEVCALTQAGDHARGADMYVTLEPCCHHGKTPPCTDAIIRAGISHVIIPIIDPNPKVSGKGVETLRAAGVTVTILSELEEHARQILNPFFTRIEKRRPHVLYKMAHTADGFTATNDGHSQWISNTASRCIAHRLRSCADAILIGKNTALLDNPSLTCRLKDFSESVTQTLSRDSKTLSGIDNIFLRYILSESFDHVSIDPFRMMAGLPGFTDSAIHFIDDNNCIIFEREEIIAQRKNDRITAMLIERKLLHGIQPGADITEAIMQYLYEKGALFVLLEGGSTLAGSFFKKKFVDQYLSVTAPKLLGSGRNILNGVHTHAMSEAVPLRDISTCMIDGDLIYHGYL